MDGAELADSPAVAAGLDEHGTASNRAVVIGASIGGILDRKSVG